jgi:hypothetical protein
VFQERVHHIEEQLSHILGHSVPSYDRCPSLWEALSTRKPPGIAAPDHTVPTGRFFWGDASQALRARLRSVLSLRDENDRCCPYGTKTIGAVPTGRNPYGTKSLRDEIPTGRNPYGTKSLRDEIPTGRNTFSAPRL